MARRPLSSFFFFNDTATTEIYTLSLHDALPISMSSPPRAVRNKSTKQRPRSNGVDAKLCVSARMFATRSEEHTSELQSPCNLVCRLLLEKKKPMNIRQHHYTLHRSLGFDIHDCA